MGGRTGPGEEKPDGTPGRSASLDPRLGKRWLLSTDAQVVMAWDLAKTRIFSNQPRPTSPQIIRHEKLPELEGVDVNREVYSSVTE